MNSLQPLMVLLSHSERERDELRTHCEQAASAQRHAAAQAEQLVTYRGEYEQRWTTQFRTDGRMELVNCYRGFMERLTLAVVQQQHVASQAEARFDAARERLREAEQRVASVRKLIERRVHEARLLGERREQKATDEFAARAAWSVQAMVAQAHSASHTHSGLAPL